MQFRNANQRNSWQSRDCRAAATILVASTWETLIAGAAVGSKPGRPHDWRVDFGLRQPWANVAMTVLAGVALS